MLAMLWYFAVREKVLYPPNTSSPPQTGKRYLQARLPGAPGKQNKY